MSSKIKLWAAGLATAAAGLILARVVSGLFAGQAVIQFAVFLIGVALALAGLLIILMGVRKAR
jgi:hypothetical protein